MIILATLALITVVIAVFFIAIVIGLHQAHPTDLTVQRPTCFAALATRVVGLHVRTGEPVQSAMTGTSEVVIGTDTQEKR